MRSRTFAILATLLVSALGAAPQAVEPGDRVVLAAPDDFLKIEERVVATGRVHRVYTVGRSSGSWLWLEAEDAAGWVKADRVIPFDRALDRATRRIEEGEATARAYNERGLLWADRGRTDLAVLDYAEAIRIEPEWYLPRLNRALAHRVAGRFEEALADLDRAAELYRLDPLVYYNRGLVRLDRAEPELALDNFDLALRVDANHASSRFNRAALALALGREGASADAESYLALAGWYESRSPYAAILAVLDHRRAGRAAQADGLLAAAAEELDPEAWPAPILDYLRGDREPADAIAAAETPEQRAEAVAYLGFALAQAGEIEEARALLEGAEPFGDPSRVPYYLAAAALEALEGESADPRAP